MHRVLMFLLVPLALYLALVAALYVGQRSLLYLPRNHAMGTEELAPYGLRRWPDEDGYHGYLLDPPSAEATVVLFHGNAGDAIARLGYADALAFMPARLLFAEYPGYGARAGSPSEDVLVADARETLALVREAFPDEPLYVFGESLGAGVAAAALGADGLDAPRPAVDGLALFTPWNSLAETAARHYRFVPARRLLRDRYRSDVHLRNVDAPKVVVVAELDRIVPAELGRALFDALPGPKRLVTVVGAGHNDWFGRVDETWWRALWSTLTGVPDRDGRAVRRARDAPVSSTDTPPAPERRP